MPPLYRMPITYVALVLVGGVVGLVALGSGNEPAPGPVVEEGPTPPPEIGPDPDDPILRTPEGLRRKVLVRHPRLRHRDAPQGIMVGEEVNHFSIAYVYEEAEGAVRVGGDDGQARGWLPRSSLIDWNTRLMLRPVSRRAAWFAAKECLLHDLAGRACPQHTGEEGCPHVPVPEDQVAKESPMGWPVIQTESVPRASGPDRTIFEVALLLDEGAPVADVRIPESDLKALRELYVAIVMASSSSMEKFIGPAKEFARQLAAQAAEGPQDVRLHLALVEYRDERAARDGGNFEFLTRTTSPFVTPEQFVQALEKVQKSSQRDNSMPEQPLAGLDVALPGAGGALKWPTGRAGDLAGKLVVLIGDAPDHERNAAKTVDLARRAREARVTIATVAIRNNELHPKERELYESIWKALAAGSYRPLDIAAQFERPIAPLELTMNDPAALVPTFQRLIDDNMRRALELAKLARAEAENKLEEYRTREGLTMDQLAPVLRDLRRPARPPEEVLREGGQRAPAIVERGWVAQRHGDEELVRLELLMSRAELDRLIEDLRDFHRAILSEATSLTELIGMLASTTSGERGFLDRNRGSETFADYLSRQGLPPARAESPLRRRQTDLLQTDELLRKELEDALARAILELTRRREAGDWTKGPLVDKTMTWVPYAPIDF